MKLYLILYPLLNFYGTAQKMSGLTTLQGLEEQQGLERANNIECRPLKVKVAFFTKRRQGKSIKYQQPKET